jgi:cell division protein FtsB
MPSPVDPRRVSGRPQASVPLRPRRPEPAPTSSSPVRSRIVNYVLALVTIVLVVDALVGDKGLLETIRARRQYEAVEAALNARRQENNRLREEIRRLREDPTKIEAIAREELGLIRPGETVFILHDADRH